MSGKISRIILFVSNVKKCAEFYRDVLEMKVIGKIDPGWTELKGGSCNLALHKASGKYLRNGMSPYKIVFKTKDVARKKSLLEKKNCPMGKIFSFDGMNFCDGSDPEGNKFQISDR